MKLETWLDGNMEIMHIILFCTYGNNSGCYGNEYTRNNAKIVINWDPAITLKPLNIFFMKLETWLDGNMEIMHIILFCSYGNNSGCYYR